MRLMRNSINRCLIVCLCLLCLPVQAQLNPDVDRDTSKWFNRVHQLGDVLVNTSRRKYSRKNNPAVELMRRVIERKKATDLQNRDFYQYYKYQKLTFAINEVTPPMLASLPKKWDFLANQIELCPQNNKLMIPLTVDETVTQRSYRRSPRAEKNRILGQNSTGINDFFQTGDILTETLKDVFTDVNIYDDQVRLFQFRFTSPIGKGAIAFYRYYIQDTLYVERDRCIHLRFLPNNQQDFGFSGDLYVLDDSTCQVKRCELSLPASSDVNFVENMRIEQQFTQLADGTWVLSVDDLMVELKFASFLQKFVALRKTRLTDYSFDALPRQLFRGSQKEERDAYANMRGEEFWTQYRQVRLSRSERSMDSFLHRLGQMKGFRYVVFGLKALIENFVETGHPSKVDIGPVNTMLTGNFVDGFRTRLSAQTTANLHPHLFLSGYYARGWGSRKNYYKAELTYSFNKKEYLPREYPKRTLTFTSTYDVMSPSDKFMHTDKDNVFTALKWAKADAMMFYNRQQLAFEWEWASGLKTTFNVKTEANEAVGSLAFTPLSALTAHTSIKFRTTELRAGLEYCPGATYINTKQRRRKVNLDAPVFTLSHTVGIRNLLGGDYDYNYTEASIFKRFWLGSWGKMDCRLRGGVQWNEVPYPLLILPETNLSYIIQDFTFEAINNMEFPTDRFLSAQVNWDLSGKLFNRIPLLRKLKWREWIGVRCLWGALSDRNNPTLAENAGSPLLMAFPEGACVIDPARPYWEISLGIHNIFKLIHVEYVRRLNYNHLPTAHKHGVRFMVQMTF